MRHNLTILAGVQTPHETEAEPEHWVPDQDGLRTTDVLASLDKLHHPFYVSKHRMAPTGWYHGPCLSLPCKMKMED